MDSGNSGSLQSSSTGGGGDEEYDSRAAASFFDNGGVVVSNPPPLFDPFSNFIPLHQNPNPFFTNPNTALPEPASIRSDPNPALDDVINPFLPSFQPPVPAAVGAGTAARKPKKRSRASRRAPTTVLTTDTSNFRAMVQEFTGIPSPPFDHPSRSRFDLYGQRSSVLEPYPPPYLRRPFPRKAQSPPPFLQPSPTNAKTSSISSTIGIPNSVDPIDFQFLPHPILASLLQTNPKFPIPNSSPITESKSNSFSISPNHIKTSTLDGLMNPGNQTNPSLQTLISSNQIAAENTDVEARARNPTNGNTNPTASASNGRRGSTTGAGMVESWICSSSE